MANPVFVKTTDSYIAALMKVTLNAAPGNTYLNQFRSFVTENGGGTTGLQKLGSALANYASTDNAAFAASVVANLGITGDLATTATTNVKALLDSYGADRGKALMQLVDIMVNLQSDATWGAAANTFVNAANAGYVYSVNTANTSTDLTVLAAAVSTTGGVVATPGQTFTLTAGADSVSPTSADAAFKTTTGDDTIRAVVANSLETIDFIDGGDGNDTLTIGAFDNAAAPVIKNVETIYLRADTDADAFDATDVTGAKTIIVEGTDAAGTDFNTNVNNIALGTAIAVKNQEANVAFDFAAATGGADAVSLDVFDFGAAAGTDTLTIDEIETLTINVSGTSKFTIASADALETLNITGNKALTLDADAATADLLTTIDGSAATGALTIDADSGAAAVTVKGGSGADTITVDGAFADQLTGNGGADTFVIAVGGNITAAPATVSALNKLLVTVTDFAGADTLDLSGIVSAAGAEVALTGTDLADIADEATLLAAVTKAAGFAGGTNDDVVAFQYGDNSYVLVDEDNDQALSANDTLIKLTGVTSVAADDVVIA